MTGRELLSLELHSEQDVVLARQRARQLAALIGFDAQDQTRIATAVSEVARNAVQYAGGGRVEYLLDPSPPPSFLLRVSDRGPGVRDLEAVLEGRFRSTTGMGLGLSRTRRLLDTFRIESAPGRGTKVLLGKALPRKATDDLAALSERVARELGHQRPAGLLEEVQAQNQELLRTLDELRLQKDRLAQTNRELEDTNRGVVALFAELDERADYLRRANEVKTRFLSNMTHEFRTPLNSILSLTRLLLDRVDGPLTDEQERQIQYMRRAADDLSDLVNDLLDLSKVEAGKILVRPVEFEVQNLFGALRGMLRPLLARGGEVRLLFEDPVGVPPLRTDESKVSQILRNFISNALKYTEHGEVRVSARRGPGDVVVFSVTDTGIGVASEDQDRIFEEFTQIESPLQRRVRGTGLGLPLSRKLAALLGGTVGVRSALGEGSTFFAAIPREYQGPPEVAFAPEVSRRVDSTRAPVLVLEDNREALFVYEKFLKNTGFQVIPARTLREAREWLRVMRPVALVADILLEGESSWGFIHELKRVEATRDIPVVVVTVVENERRARELGADAYAQKPVERGWLVATLQRLTSDRPQERLLVIDDDEISRYLLRGLLAETRFGLLEAATGLEGLRRAREERPRAVFLDIAMAGLDGFAVLAELKKDPATREIPVIIYTSRVLSDEDRERLAAAVAVVPKEMPSRAAGLASLRHALVAAGLGEPPAPARPAPPPAPAVRTSCLTPSSSSTTPPPPATRSGACSSGSASRWWRRAAARRRCAARAPTPP